MVKNKPEIIFEDENIIAINKPSGLVIHSGVNTDKTLVDFLLKKYPEIKDVGESYIDEKGQEILRPGIVHRLDKETSGILVVARNEESYKTLKSHFQKGKIKKEYTAFVYGKPKKERDTLFASIYRNKKDIRKRTTRANGGKAREAITDYVLVKTKDNVSLMKFFPKTGRTHQIRVHAQSANIPIVCDSLYAAKMESKLGFDRLALHAHRLLINTHLNEELELIAPYPKDFQKAIAEFEKSS